MDPEVQGRGIIMGVTRLLLTEEHLTYSSRREDYILMMFLLALATCILLYDIT